MTVFRTVAKNLDVCYEGSALISVVVVKNGINIRLPKQWHHRLFKSQEVLPLSN